MKREEMVITYKQEGSGWWWEIHTTAGAFLRASWCPGPFDYAHRESEAQRDHLLAIANAKSSRKV